MALKTLDDLRSYCGLDQPAWAATSAALGTVPNVRTLAMLPAGVVTAAIARARLRDAGSGGGGEETEGTGGRELSAVEAVTSAYMWRLARRLLGLPDIDPYGPAPVVVPPPQAVVQPVDRADAPPQKKVKVATVLDQSDETEVRQLGQLKIKEMFAEHIRLTGAEPLPEAEPSPEQMSAMLDRVVHRDDEPYADFSVLTPFGRRVQKALRLRSWLLQADGTYKAVDVPGPPSFQAWAACWKVYRAVLYMLQYPADGLTRAEPIGVVTPAAMEEYAEHFSQLQAEYPECWHLCAAAEDRCRGELFPRLRRELERLHSANRSINSVVFDPRQPWAAVFVAAARDEAFWDREVRRPAISFLARGSSVAVPAVSAQASEALAGILGKDSGNLKLQNQNARGPPGQGTSRGAHSRRMKRQKEGPPAPPLAAGSGGGAGKRGGANSTSGPPYSLTREGKQICFKFARGGRGACADVCPANRAHVCQYCLQPHSNSECDSRRGGGKGSGKGGK